MKFEYTKGEYPKKLEVECNLDLVPSPEDMAEFTKAVQVLIDIHEKYNRQEAKPITADKGE